MARHSDLVSMERRAHDIRTTTDPSRASRRRIASRHCRLKNASPESLQRLDDIHCAQFEGAAHAARSQVGSVGREPDPAYAKATAGRRSFMRRRLQARHLTAGRRLAGQAGLLPPSCAHRTSRWHQDRGLVSEQPRGGWRRGCGERRDRARPQRRAGHRPVG